MKTWLLAFLILWGYLAYGLNSSGSLDSIFQLKIKPEEKVDRVLQFFKQTENQFSENEIAINALNRTLNIAEGAGYTRGKVNCLLKLGSFYFRSSEYVKAMEMNVKARGIAEDLDYNLEVATALGQMGTIYNELGDYDNSSQYFFNSLKLYEKIGDKEGIARALGDIGMDFCNQQDYPKALYYFNKALVIAKSNNDLSLMKRQYNNIAVVYSDQKQFDKAIVYLNEAQSINAKLRDKLGQGTNIMNIGYIYLNNGEIDKAIPYFQRSLDLFTELDNRIHMAECYINFGFSYYQSRQLDKGILYFKKALVEGEKNNYYRIISYAAQALNNIYAEKKDTIQAYRYAMLEKSADDSLSNSPKQLSNLEVQYLFEKQELQRQIEHQARQNMLKIIIFGLVSGMIILMLLFYGTRLKSRYIKLEKEKVESELDIKNRELTVNLISLIKKNEMLSDLSNRLIQLEKTAKSEESRDIISKISQELRSGSNDKMLNEFSTRFQEVHAGFYEKLLKAFPDLTQNELKLCAFLRLNMSTKDISELTGQLQASIDQARYRLRKKLGISSSETNLVTFLSQL